MERFRKLFRQLTAIRLISLILITGLTLTISSSFLITRGAYEVADLMAAGAGFDRVYHTEEEVSSGRMMWALYASLGHAGPHYFPP